MTTNNTNTAPLFPSHPRPRARASALAALAVLVAAALAACSWSVPADPGLNAARRGRAAAPSGPAAGDSFSYSSGAPSDGAREIYLARCTRCHEAFAPSHASPGMWSVYVRRYGPRAGLFGEERERVLRWLQASSR